MALGPADSRGAETRLASEPGSAEVLLADAPIVTGGNDTWDAIGRRRTPRGGISPERQGIGSPGCAMT